MKRVCICCGEEMGMGNALSRHPNICASCSSMVDGMEEPSLASLEKAQPVLQAQSKEVPSPAETVSRWRG